MIAIIDYGMGNLASVHKAITKLGITSLITSNENEIKNSSGIILPGVGSFRQGMINLENLGLIPILKDEVIHKKKPFLGICLGMQLIFETGSEPAECAGLGWIKGKVVPIVNEKLPVPHLGWNNIYSNSSKKDDSLQTNFYFIHSYHVEPNEPVESNWVDYEFPILASVKKNNIFATQFHPEKSQQAGLDLIESYFKSYVKS